MDDEMRSLLESIPDGGPISIDQLATAAAKQGRRRRLLRVVPAVVAVAVVIVIGGLAWGAAQSPSSTVDVQGQPLGTMPSPDPSAEEYVYPDKLPRYPGWLAEHDPVEVAFLRSVDPNASDVRLVVTLEYRLACRSTSSVLDELEQLDPADVPARSEELMAPIVARLTEREPSPASSADDQFQRLAEQLRSGDVDGVRTWTERNCAVAAGLSVPEAIEAQQATGWVPYLGDDALHPERLMDRIGWIRWGGGVVQPGKVEVYDEPDGTVIGYAYNLLGFVPVEADGSFDAHAERIRRHGCDTVVEPACVTDPGTFGTGPPPSGP